MLDLLITGGSVLDGTGVPARQLEIGVKDGRVVSLDRPGARPAAAHIIDVEGLSVAPGFVDIHVHYDAQVFWDGACTPSSLHGMTTAFGGNCGFSIAPLFDDPDYILRLLSRVEGIPAQALAEGVSWKWRSFEEYLDAVEQTGTAVNFGALVGHSAVRRATMGERSGESQANDADITKMKQLIRESLAAGAMGFSSSWTEMHFDGDGNPVPSRAASIDELESLSAVVADFPGAQLEFVPTNAPFDDQHAEVMIRMALAGRAPLNWNLLIPRDRAETEPKLAVSDRARRVGARVFASSYPDRLGSRTSFLGTSFGSLPGWGKFISLSPHDRIAALQRPDVRSELRAGADEAGARGVGRGRYESFVVSDTSVAHRPLIGRTIGDIAAELGKEPFDALCDLVVADQLHSLFAPPMVAYEGEWELRRKTWIDPRVLIGGSDGGAHLDTLTTFNYPARYLAFARQYEELTLPAVVRQLTQVPAALYGVVDRGHIAVGAWADLVVFDPDTVDAGPIEWVDDLPGGAGRLSSRPVGIFHTVVNGVRVVEGGELTGELPGKVLRRGRDAGVATALSR